MTCYSRSSFHLPLSPWPTLTCHLLIGLHSWRGRWMTPTLFLFLSLHKLAFLPFTLNSFSSTKSPPNLSHLYFSQSLYSSGISFSFLYDHHRLQSPLINHQFFSLQHFIHLISSFWFLGLLFFFFYVISGLWVFTWRNPR